MFHVITLKKTQDRLAPSKKLQDAKDKLGPLYYDSRILECPQNAVELSKLLDEWADIDRQCHRHMEERKKTQKALEWSLRKYQPEDMSDEQKEIWQDTSRVASTPSGFRYHANGDVKEVTKSRTSMRLDVTSALNMAADPSRSKSYSLPSTRASTAVPTLEKKSSENETKVSKNNLSTEVDFQKEIDSLEVVIKDIATDLAVNKIDPHVPSRSFLRAHSQTTTQWGNLNELSKPFKNPNDRFAFQPGTINFGHSSTNVSEMGKKFQNKMSSHNSCIACQFKLKHSGDDFRKLKNLTERHVRPWVFSKSKGVKITSSLPNTIDNSQKFNSEPSRIKSDFINPVIDNHLDTLLKRQRALASQEKFLVQLKAEKDEMKLRQNRRKLTPSVTQDQLLAHMEQKKKQERRQELLNQAAIKQEESADDTKEEQENGDEQNSANESQPPIITDSFSSLVYMPDKSEFLRKQWKVILVSI